jgi:hypothetical protein
MHKVQTHTAVTLKTYGSEYFPVEDGSLVYYARRTLRRRAGQSTAGRRSTGNAAWHNVSGVSAYWEVGSFSLAKWTMAELIALSSESGSDEEMETLMLLYLTSKRYGRYVKESIWKREKLTAQ